MTSVDVRGAPPMAIEYDPFAQAKLARVVPAIEPQREVWLAAKLEPDASLAYNEGISLHLRGALDVNALRDALGAVVARHDALRATLSPDGAELCIAEHVDTPWLDRDLAALSPPARDAEVEAILRRVVETPFDLEQGPLLRAELLRLGADDHLIVLSAHHIVCDGWSWGVIVRDLATAYGATLDRRAPALEPGDSFADFALTEVDYANSDACQDAERYWLGRFANLPPALDLPTDRPRPRLRTFASLRRDLALDADLVKAVTQAGAQRGASLYAILLAAFAVLLHRLSGQDDLVIGIPAAGQAADGHHGLVGHAVNILPLRTEVLGNAPFAETLARVRGDLLDAFEHRRYTFGTLLKRLAMPRDPARLPLMSVLFNLDRALGPEQVSFPALEFELATLPRSFENFELFINAVQVDGALCLECQYNSDLFDAATITRWLDAYATLLKTVAAEPARTVSTLPLVSMAGLEALRALQPAPTPFERARRVEALVFEQAARAPARPALSCGEVRWTYAELAARAQRIASALRARGIADGALVGIALERGPDMLASMLGVLQAGAGYVPLDPAFPRERLDFMVEDAKLALLVTQTALTDTLDWPRERTLVLDAAGALDSGTDITAESVGGADAVAYVIYTSGSTGKPKGVRVPHRAVVNFLTSMRREPGLTESDRLVAVTTLSFDIAVLELFLPLCVGAEVLLATRTEAIDGHALAELIDRRDASAMQATPATWRLLLEAGWQGHAGFKALCGGEALPVDLAQALLPRCGTLWNLYGPTETTVWSTCWRVEHPERGITIGRPIANTTVWILDAARQPCPIGVPGEIVIGGEGVTLGYLARQELTADRFIADPFATNAGARLYRTGDRGRWRNDGTLEHLDRLDFQVKLRGFRLELGEIEANLVTHPAIARAVAIVREDRPGDQRLVAYVTARAGASIDAAVLRAHLRTTLPDYMLPQHYILLEAIPLLPNGKINRKALPVPQASADEARERIAPRDPRESRIAAIMEEVLALPGLGVDDDFFALGGHSLLAAQFTAQLNREFGVALSFRTLFDAPTIKGLSIAIGRQLDSGSQVAQERIIRRADQSHGPASLMQQRLWFLEEMNPGRVAYNTPSAHRLRGHLDEEAFERAFAAMVQRQSVLRTLLKREDDRILQIVEPAVDVTLFPAEDLAVLPEDEREATLMRRLQEMTDTPFDLTSAPLFRARMFKLGTNEHVLFFMPHHIIWDGWSFDLFYVELSELYRAFRTGTQPKLPELPVSYGDFAVWHTHWLDGPQLQTQLAFWRERLGQAGEPENLPADKPRRPGMSGQGRTEWIQVSKEQTDAMHEVARLSDATLNMGLLALHYILLYEMTGQCDLVIGTPVRGRNLAEVESVMGYFTNLVPLHLTLKAELPFVDFVREVKRVVVDSFGNPDVPLEYLQRELNARYGGNALLYQALFSFQDARQRVRDWGGLSHEQVLLFQSGATEDLGIWFLENAQGMIGGVTHNMDVFRIDTAHMLHKRYLELLARVVADPHQPIASLTRINDVDLAQIERWNTTAGPAIEDESIDTLFEARVDHAPTAVALTSGGRNTSYSELERRANHIGACLRRRGVGKGSVVALAAAPGVDRIAGLLGIFKAGAICIPLDREAPSSRLKAILADASVDVVIGDANLGAALDWPRARALWFDADAAEILAAADTRVIPRDIDAGEPAVVIHMPNASNLPHAQVFTHRAIVQVMGGLRRAIDIRAEDRILGTAGPDTGAWVLESLLPLIGGCESVLVGRAEVLHGETLSRLLESSGAGVVFATADIWQRILAVDAKEKARIKAVCTGGTPKPPFVEKILARYAELWNVLVTDADIMMTCGRVQSPSEEIHVGKPLAGNAIWVLGTDGQPRPIGAIGEICVEGISVGQAWGAHQEQSAGTDEDAWLPIFDRYPRRTGYCGRWLANGYVEELGRLDRRLRIEGHVVEPGEIETVALAEASVREAVAIAREFGAGDRCLVLYVAAEPSETLVARLRDRLRGQFPDYMVPRYIERLDALPKTPNGKVDYKTLPPPVMPLPVDPVALPPARPIGSLERSLMEIWRELLRVREIGIHDDFFDLGGDSLLAVRLFQRAQKLTGINLPLATLLTAPTIARQAAAFRAAGAREPEMAEPAIFVDGSSRDPWALLVPIKPSGSLPTLFCVHAVGGNVLNYVPLAKALDRDQPFYGVQAIGLDGITQPLDSLTEMASRYLAEIRLLQPRGPYFLAGGSMGGMIAYEMAQQIRAAGETVALLALFDTYGPGNRQFEIKLDDPISLMGRRWRNRLERAGGTDARGKLAMLVNAVGWRTRRAADVLRIRWARARKVSLPHELRYREVERVHEQAYLAYKPQTYDGPIVLFRAAQQCEGMNASHTLGWETVAGGGIEVIVLPGNHDTLIEQPALIEHLHSALERAHAAVAGQPTE